MKWSEQAWASISPIYNKILELPFIGDLMSGKLDRNKFIFYIQQDALYLSDYSKVLAAIASKLNDPQQSAAFLGFAGESMVVEKALHESFIHQIDKKDRIEASPSCLLYTSFLLRQLANAPTEVILASVLPCFWIYKEVGDYILAHQSRDNNPYQSWIDTYGGEDFGQSVITAIKICDSIAEKCTEEQQKAMTEAFVMCAKMEWLFWHSAYNKEQWEI